MVLNLKFWIHSTYIFNEYASRLIFNLDQFGLNLVICQGLLIGGQDLDCRLDVRIEIIRTEKNTFLNCFTVLVISYNSSNVYVTHTGRMLVLLCLPQIFLNANFSSNRKWWLGMLNYLLPWSITGRASQTPSASWLSLQPVGLKNNEWYFFKSQTKNIKINFIRNKTIIIVYKISHQRKSQ